MATITNIPNGHRSSCVSPSSHGSSSSVSSATDSSTSCDNPLNLLVSAVEVVKTKSPPSIPDSSKHTFSESLMSVLDDPQYEDVIAWMPDGNSFTIKDHKKFTRDLMPKLFSIRNMSSFVRKLTRWGFTRAHEKETCNSDIFKHVNFKRDNLELCRKVKCVGRLQAKSSPVSAKKKTVGIDLTTLDRPHLHPSSPRAMAKAVGTTGDPSDPSLVTPPSTNKAFLRLEHARRMSALSRPRAFGGRSRRTHVGFEDMTATEMEASGDIVRRDEETVIVAMPKKYLQTTHRPGMRVLSSGFGPQLPFQPVADQMMHRYSHHGHPHFYPCHPPMPPFQRMRQGSAPLPLRPGGMPMGPGSFQQVGPPAAAYAKRPL